jgi:Kelch motif
LQGTSWQKGQAYPLNVAEAQGAMVETKLVLMSGFFGSWSATTPEAYALDTALSNSAPAAVAASWQRLDDQLASPSLTHAPVVAIGTKLYMCGGYKGGGEGPTTNTCLVLDISKPNGQQWSMFAPLPGIGHAGGGMVYDKTLNALFYAGGALRIKGKKTVDLNNTWMYSFDKSTAGWVARAPIPFKANHMSSTTAKDGSGVEHHFFVGGQEAENEAYGNVVHHYEYDAINDQWLPRQSLPYPRGHASASTIPFGCGYLVIGGTTNGWQRTPDVTYYDIATDAWTKIGELPFGINTPICDINRVTNMLYCESGGLNFAFSWKRQVLIA